MLSVKGYILQVLYQKEMLMWEYWWIECGYQKSKEEYRRQQREIENATVTRAMAVYELMYE